MRAFCGAVRRLGQLYMDLQLSLKCQNLPQLIVLLKGYVRVVKATGKTFFPSAFLLESVGKPQRKQSQASAEKGPTITFLHPPVLVILGVVCSQELHW